MLYPHPNQNQALETRARVHFFRVPDFRSPVPDPRYSCSQEERQSAEGQTAAPPSETPDESRSSASGAAGAAGATDETAAAAVGGDSGGGSDGSRNADVLRRLQLPLFSPTRETRDAGGGGGESSGDAGAARDNVEAMVERAMDSAVEAEAQAAAVAAGAQGQGQAAPTAMAVEDSASGESCGGWGRGRGRGGRQWSFLRPCVVGL